jgi:hypothetical protein
LWLISARYTGCGWNKEIYKKLLRRRGDRIRKRDIHLTVTAPVSSCSNLQYTANYNLLYRSFCSLFFSFFWPSPVFEIREANVGVRCYSKTIHTNTVSAAQVRERQAAKQYHRGLAKVGGWVGEGGGGRGTAAPGQQSPREGKRIF